jgi:peptide/nickel transport system ATP-binding protein
VTTKPRHPYTRLLINSLPEVGVRHATRRLTGIEGSPPSLLNPTTRRLAWAALPAALTGCRFRDRCPLADAGCAAEPPVAEVAPRHYVACWKA